MKFTTLASSLLSLLLSSTTLNAQNTPTGTIAITISANNAFSPQCSNGVWAIFGFGMNVAVSVKSNTGTQTFTQQPMAETIQDSVTQQFATINMNFFIGNQAAPLTVSGAFNVAPGSTTSGNTWTFALQDDQPNIGASFFVGSAGVCQNGQSGATAGITASFTYNSPFIHGVGANQIPAVSALPTVINGLQPTNQPGGATTLTTLTPTTFTAKATTAKATTKAATTAAGNTGKTSYVVTFAADPGQNGGNGINNIQCNGGFLTATINLLASININNIHAYQPMAELGLPTINMAFMLNGKPGNVMVMNAFNVATSTALGPVWQFALQDDGPHPGGQLGLGQCTPGQIPTITVSFTSASATISAAGLPNGADGGPPVPAVNNVVPTIVNALPAQFNGGNVVVPTVTPTTAKPTVFVPTTRSTATASTTGSLTIVMTASAYQPQCNNNGNWMLFFQGYSVAITATLGAVSSTGAPMDENGAPLTTINGAWFLDGAPAVLKVTSPTNIANSMSSGNIWSFNLQNDQPSIGAAFEITPPTKCTFSTPLPRISTFFSTNSFVMAPGGNGNPAVNAVPTVVNNLPPANLASATGGPSGKVTMPAPTNAAIPTTPAPQQISQTIITQIQMGGYCTNNFLTVSMALMISQNGLPPMAENGLPTITAAVTKDGNPVNVISLNAYNMSPKLNGNTFTFAELDDQANVGGQLTVNIPCSYTVAGQAPTATGIALSFSSSMATVNGNQMPVVLNAIPSQQDMVPMPEDIPMTMTEAPTTSSSSMNSLPIIIGVVVGVVVLIAVITASVIYVKRKNQTATNKEAISMANRV